MAVTWLRKLAASVPVPVFPAIGQGVADRVDDLFLSPELAPVASPRHASVLLIAGDIRNDDRESLHRIHDQLPHPRATLHWGAELLDGFELAERVPADGDPATALSYLHRRLFTGKHPSEPHLLADEPPNPWRGLGDHGQGGEGMMGGTPYGRMMPMPPQADLRDGLTLDVYTAPFGPFLPTLPPGLALEMTLQGDVVQAARVIQPPLPPASAMLRPLVEAARGDIAIATLERARAGHHLRCLAQLLTVLELLPWAERCRRMAHAVECGETVDIVGLRRGLAAAGAFAAVPGGLGRLPAEVAEALGGVAARASGINIDARTAAEGYRALGFHPISLGGGDVRARMKQWLLEVGQAVALARQATDRQVPANAAERPWRGETSEGLGASVAFVFTDLLVGLEWGEAMRVIASFDAASLRCMCPANEALAGVEHRNGAGW